MWILMRVPRPRGSPSVSSLTAKLPSALLSHSHCLSSLCLLTTYMHTKNQPPMQHMFICQLSSWSCSEGLHLTRKGLVPK